MRPKSLVVCALAAAAAISIAGMAGCAEKSGVHEETKVTTPEGSKTIERDTKVKTTGDNPPSAPSGTTTTTKP